MMKKIRLFVLVLALFLFLPLFALGESYDAVIANPSAADRLNLREKPNASSESLGRFYSGAPVRVLWEADEEWVYVLLGNLNGYMLKEYLMPVNRNYGAPSLFYTADTMQSQVPLRVNPKNSAQLAAVIQGKVDVLGDIGDDWRYVYSHSAGEYGYVRTNQLRNNAIDIPLAFLQGQTTIYSDKTLKKEIAQYASGTPVRVTNMARTGYAKVEIYGLPYGGDFYSMALEGYIPLSSLNVFTQIWQVNYSYQTYQALSDFSFTNLYDGQSVSVPRGAFVSVVGETDGKYHIIYGQTDNGSYSTGLVSKTKLHNAGRKAGYTGPGRMGYALLNQEIDPDGYAMEMIAYVSPNGEQDESIWRPLAEVIGDENGYLQLRNPDDRNFFMPNTQAKVITAEQLQVNSVRKMTAGEWTASQADEGLWGFEVEAGQSACLTITDEATNKHEVYDVTASGKEHYAVYIPAGAKVTLSGNGSLWANMTASINDQLRWKDYTEEEIFFSGSGRYFCDTQIGDFGTWFDYTIKPIPGAEDSYCVLSNLFTQEGEEIKIIFDENTTFFRTNRWDLFPGTFLELHNCIITLYYGNG